MHEISNFLQRPIKIWSGNFSTSHKQGQVLWQSILPEELFANKMYNEKIAGFTGFRGDVELTIQVNAQKFQQGRLRLQYIPYAKYLEHKVNMINSSLTGRTSSPGIDIDICGGDSLAHRSNEIKYHIPYVSPHMYINLITNLGTIGTAYLIVYSPLLSASATDCEITVWANFVNPQLCFPTSEKLHSSLVRNYTAQIAGELKEIQKEGIVSKTLGKVGAVLSIGKKIPIIGKYCETPEWLVNGARDIAKFFGWAKPTAVIDTKLRTTNCMSNFDGKDSSHKMAMSAINELATSSEILASKEDEMTFNSIVRKPAFLNQFKWSTQNVVENEILWVETITPTKFVPIPDSTGRRFGMLPISSIANCFGLWRGSLKFTFKFVKTGFHAGRLRIFYVPYGNLANFNVGTTPKTEIEKNYQVVVDIGESNEIDFVVPYVSTRPWTNTSPSLAKNSESTTGLLVVTVLNELRAVDTVAQEINTLVELSAGEDFNVACPTLPRFSPNPTTISPQYSFNSLPSESDYNTSSATYPILSAYKTLGYLPTRISSGNANLIAANTEIAINGNITYKDVYSVRNMSAIGIYRIPDSGDIVGLKFASTPPMTVEVISIGESEWNVYDGIIDNSSFIWYDYRNTHFIVGTVSEISSTTREYHAQIGEMNEETPTFNWTPESYCIGEKIASIRQLIKRSNPVGKAFQLFKNNISNNTTAANAYTVINPFANRVIYQINSSVGGLDYMSYFSSFFAFFRGGVRIKLFTSNNPSNMGVYMFNAYDPYYDNIVTRTLQRDSFQGLTTVDAFWNNDLSSYLSTSASSIMVDRNVEGAIEFEVPYYNASHITPAIVSESLFPAVEEEGAEGCYPSPVVLFGLQSETIKRTSANDIIPAETSTNITIYRSASDDFSFSYYIGTPAVYLTHAVFLSKPDTYSFYS